MDTPLVDKVIADRKKRARIFAALFATGFTLVVGWLTAPLVIDAVDDVAPATTDAPITVKKQPNGTTVISSDNKTTKDGLLKPAPKGPTSTTALREALKSAQPNNPNFARDFERFEQEMRELEEKLK